jgi:ferric-dicitrate binding protein FerR (iron transport regulator)
MPRSHRFNKGQLKISLPRLAAAVISIIGLSIAFSYLFFHESKVQTVDNKLVVPSGQQAQLTLSDGTKIWLNSRSELRYPGNFTGNNREVFLDGEAYFEVTHDPDMPFIVRSKYLGIKVLGTSFNFSAYKDDAAIRMTLVEGLVSIIDSRNKMLLQLKPQQTAVYSKAGKRITLSGGDTDIYISWREGQFKFRKMSFDEISSRLGRNFNVVFRIQNEEMKHTTFSGSFYNYESLDQILRILQRNYPFHYEINGNEVLIK